MRWLKKFKHLWSVEKPEPLSPAELEKGNIKKLEKEYSQKKDLELKDAHSVLESEETSPEEIYIKKAKEYDVGEIEADELLDESKLESHYGLNVINAELEGSDDHLLGAEQIEP